MLPSMTSPVFSNDILGSGRVPYYSKFGALSSASISSPSSSTLNDGIISHWNMDETSGVRNDDVSTHNATSFNSPGYISGLNGNAADLNGTTQRLQVTDDTDFDRISTDFMWVAGVKFDVETLASHIISRWSTSSIEQQFALYISGSTFRFLVRETSGASNTVSATGFGTISSGTWYMVSAYKTGQNIGLRINTGAKETEINMGADMYDVSNDISFGATKYGSNFMNGHIDFISYYNRELTIAELTELYNGGAWKGYPY